LPLIEDLQRRWEEKRDGAAGFERFAVYRAAIQDGLDKVRKYYDKFDEKPAYLLALSEFLSFLFLGSIFTSYSIVLHPYYKLDYIKHAWGGEEEQEAERAAGNQSAKNWQDEALKIFERTVSILIISHLIRLKACLIRRNTIGRAGLNKRWSKRLPDHLQPGTMAQFKSLITIDTAKHCSKKAQAPKRAERRSGVISRKSRKML
jgi:hypothetical protein